MPSDSPLAGASTRTLSPQRVVAPNLPWLTITTTCKVVSIKISGGIGAAGATHPPHHMLSLIAAPLIAASPPRLTVDYAVSASKAIQGTVRVASEQWLVFSPDMRIHSSQEWQTLQPRTKPSQTGTDAFGRYDEINIAWSDDRGASIFTAIRSYAGSPGLAVCTTTFLSGVSNIWDWCRYYLIEPSRTSYPVDTLLLHY